MTTYIITNDNGLLATTEANLGTTTNGAAAFNSREELALHTAEWPLTRFVEIHNEAAGVVPFDKVRPVKKFENRSVALNRIWGMSSRLGRGLSADGAGVTEPAVEAPAPETAPASAPTKPKKAPKAKAVAKAKRTPKKPVTQPASAETKARTGTKKEEVVRLLKRANGASGKEIEEKMGWLPHTTRAFVSAGLRKAGFAVESFKRENGDRAYRISA